MNSGGHAFVDESVRNDVYMMCAVNVRPGHLDGSRKRLRKMRVRGQSRIHFSEESDGRRRRLLGELSALPFESVLYTAKTRNQVAARNAILNVMVRDVSAKGLHRLTLDARSEQDHRDRRTIQTAVALLKSEPFWYGHKPSVQEPLLWIPDGIAWAWGRGGEWRKRCRALSIVPEIREVRCP